MKTNQNAGNSFTGITEKDWQLEAEKALKTKPFDSLFTESIEKIILKPLYSEGDSEHQALPGEFPYVRGTKKSAGWRISQCVDGGESPHALKRKLDEAFKRGQNSLLLKEFSSLESVEDWKEAFNASLCSESFHAVFDFSSDPAKSAVFAAFLDVLKEAETVSLEGIAGFDPFEGVLYGEQTLSGAEEEIEWLLDYTDWSAGKAPFVKTAYFKGEHFHEAGANAVQELAYTFSKSIEWLNTVQEKGYAANQYMKKMAFSFNTDAQFFTEIAKLRAARRLWSTIASAFGGDREAQKITLHSETSRLNKSKLDFHVNLLRSTTEAFSAIAGGTDSLHISPFNEIDGTYDPLSDRIARNTHYLLSDESLLSKVTDPAGGSWYIEALTEELAQKAWKEIQKLEELGGFKEAMLSGYIQDDISAVLEKRVEDFHTRKTEMIGTNVYANKEDRLLQADSTFSRSRLHPSSPFHEQLTLHKKGETALIEKRENIQSGIKPLKPVRLSETFEGLRLNALAFKERTGSFPKVALVTFGLLKEYKARQDYVTGILSSGGLDWTAFSSENLDGIGEFSQIILCGTNDAYLKLDDQLFHAIGKSGSIWIAGRQNSEFLEQYPVAGTLYNGMNIYEFLLELHNRLGVTE